MVINTDKLFLVGKVVLVNENNQILILKRSNYKNDLTNGLWDIPGGSINEDEDINQGVIREVKEELQVELSDIQVFEISSSKGVPNGYSILVLFYSRDITLKDEIVLSHEHTEYRWIEINDLENYKFKSSQRISMIQKVKNVLINN